MLNSCFLVFERGPSGYTSKNVSLPLAEAMPFCSGFRPIQQGSMKGLKRKGTDKGGGRARVVSASSFSIRT